MYTCGVWIVKDGKEDEFKQRWQAGADAAALEFAGVKFMLLQDRDDTRRFVSLGEGWRNAEQIEAARSLPSYQDSMAETWRVLESGDISTLDLIASVS
jgi:quinol monooxygenase YgiN